MLNRVNVAVAGLGTHRQCRAVVGMVNFVSRNSGKLLGCSSVHAEGQESARVFPGWFMTGGKLDVWSLC